MGRLKMGVPGSTKEMGNREKALFVSILMNFCQSGPSLWNFEVKG